VLLYIAAKAIVVTVAFAIGKPLGPWLDTQPFWLTATVGYTLICAFGIVPLIAILTWMSRVRASFRTVKSTRFGWCLHCRYDMGRLPGPCPECGHEASLQRRRQAWLYLSQEIDNRTRLLWRAERRKARQELVQRGARL
jgi:hypothetical protein